MTVLKFNLKLWLSCASWVFALNNSDAMFYTLVPQKHLQVKKLRHGLLMFKIV